MPDLSSLKKQLCAEKDPLLGTSWSESAVTLTGSVDALTVTLTLPYVLDAQAEQALKSRLEQFLYERGACLKSVTISSKIRARVPQDGVKSDQRCRNIIAVGSGKGGVGKSTVALNLALAMARLGCRVGLLDADIYGPNVPGMLGVDEQTANAAKAEGFLRPVMAHGIQSMSMGYLVADDRPMVWRGPMVSGALMQLYQDTRWDDLDILFIDLPPGTGDVQLTLSKKIPISAAVVVTTPQPVAILDVHKGISMFQRVAVPIAGVVENMSHFQCPNCQHEADIFSYGGGAALAEALALPHLGSVPLVPSLGRAADNGQPLTTGAVAQQFEVMASTLSIWLAKQPRAYSQQLPGARLQTD